jgi:c-di-GMP-binding flagellar brake protein YcgR
MNPTTADLPQPAGIPLPEPEGHDNEDYRIHDSREIQGVLRAVIDRRVLATLHFDEGFIITSLLASNPAAGELIFDCAQDARTNQAIAAARRLKFVALVDNIKTEFTVGPAQACSFEARPAFRTGPPDSVLRLQRRSHFRVRASRNEPLVCEIPLPAGAPARFNIDDLSVGGIALLAGPDFDAFRPGAVLQGCRIDLPDHGLITTSIEMRSQVPLRDARLRVGARFLNLAGTVESLLQRYINQLERARRALL